MTDLTKETWYTADGVPCKLPYDPSKAIISTAESPMIQLVHKKTGRSIKAFR